MQTGREREKGEQMNGNEREARSFLSWLKINWYSWPVLETVQPWSFSGWGLLF